MKIVTVSIKLTQSSVMEKKILPQALFNSHLILDEGSVE